SGNGTVGLSYLRRHPGEELDLLGIIQSVFLDRSRGHSLLGQSQRRGFIPEAHVTEREIPNKAIIFRLFFEQRFQFAARLAPTFLGGGMVARDLLRPA